MHKIFGCYLEKEKLYQTIKKPTNKKRRSGTVSILNVIAGDVNDDCQIEKLIGGLIIA